MTTIEKRVAKGAEYLDRIKPGWEKKIRVRKLNMRDGCYCVGGQLFGNFWRHFSPTYQKSIIYGCGFNVREKGLVRQDKEFATLKAAWLKEITKRKKK